MSSVNYDHCFSVRHLHLNGYVLGLSGTIHCVSSRVGQPILCSFQLAIDAICVHGFHVIFGRTARQQMQACTDGIEAGVGGVFDVDYVSRIGENDISIPVIPPVVYPGGHF